VLGVNVFTIILKPKTLFSDSIRPIFQPYFTTNYRIVPHHLTLFVVNFVHPLIWDSLLKSTPVACGCPMKLNIETFICGNIPTYRAVAEDKFYLSDQWGLVHRSRSNRLLFGFHRFSQNGVQISQTGVQKLLNQVNLLGLVWPKMIPLSRSWQSKMHKDCYRIFKQRLRDNYLNSQIVCENSPR
jgi:hypothetical protein